MARDEAEILEVLWTIQPQTSARKFHIEIEFSVKMGAVCDCSYIMATAQCMRLDRQTTQK